jgi:hypothetical protein
MDVRRRRRVMPMHASRRGNRNPVEAPGGERSPYIQSLITMARPATAMLEPSSALLG